MLSKSYTLKFRFKIRKIKGKTRELLEKSGLSNWDVHLNEKSYQEIFDGLVTKENIIYLTSDSPNELADFEEDKVYIIGGLVDHNHHKSLCYDIAVKNGFSHARLPISKSLSMKTRMVLTVNQVFQIVCKYVECKDWKKAFVSTLPKRKGAETLSDDENDQNKSQKLEKKKLDEEVKEETSKSGDLFL